MRYLAIIMLFFFNMSLFGQVRDFNDIPKDVLAHLDKMGVDGSSLLNRYESAYFNVVFKDSLRGFDFTGEEVGFIYRGARSNKKEYFDLERDRLNRNDTPNRGTLYIFDETQKKESGGYDALGRRTAKIYDGRITRFVWDGDNPLHEWSYDVSERPVKYEDEFGITRVKGEEPTENVITWVFEEGTFVPIAKIQGNESNSIFSDYMGTPLQMYDTSSRLIWDCELDIYGKVRRFDDGFTGNDKYACPFRYQGQYEDEETGLYYNRFRYYHPDMGCYISQDPIGLEGNNPTLY